MVEGFNLEYKTFFEEPNCLKRWSSFVKVYKKDYGIFRVLFLVEVMAFLDKWDEPSVTKLNKFLRHVREVNPYPGLFGI